jgi:hypothetical protein
MDVLPGLRQRGRRLLDVDLFRTGCDLGAYQYLMVEDMGDVQ